MKTLEEALYEHMDKHGYSGMQDVHGYYVDGFRDGAAFMQPQLESARGRIKDKYDHDIGKLQRRIVQLEDALRWIQDKCDCTELCSCSELMKANARIALENK